MKEEMREETIRKYYSVFLLVVFLMSGVEGMNYKWIGGSLCGDIWGPQTPSTCWSPSGYPGTSEGGDSVVFPPYSNITLYAGPAYERNVGNGIYFTSYSWAGCYAIELNSIYISENSNFTLSNTFNLVVNGDFYIQENSNFVMSTADSSLIANSDVYLAGNLYSFGAVINGKGKLHILNSGSLIFDQPNIQFENFLLINTDVHGQLVQKEGSIIHTGYWWQESSDVVVINVFSTLTLSGYLYDWEEQGALVVVEGGSLTLGQVEMRGVSLQNFGSLELGEFYSSNEVIPLNSAIQNFGLIKTDKLYNHLFYETTNLTNIGGVISSTSELTINCPLSDVGGTFVSNDHSEISFASGIFVPPYQSSEYYGGVSFTGSTGSFNGTTLTGSGLFYISAPPTIYEGGLFINSNVAIDYIVVNEENVIYTVGNIYIYRGTLFASGSLLVPNNTIATPEIHVYGNLDIIESLTFSTNVTILVHTGGTMKISNSSTVNLLNDATIQYCGGNLLLEGVLNGKVVQCSTSYLDSTFTNLEEHFRLIDNRLQSYHI